MSLNCYFKVLKLKLKIKIWST